MAIYFEEIWQKVGIRSWNDSKKHCTNMERNKDTFYMHVKKQKIHDMWSWNKQRCMAHTCKKKNWVESDCKKHDTCIHVMEQEWTITTWHVSRVVRVTVSGFLQSSFVNINLLVFDHFQIFIPILVSQLYVEDNVYVYIPILILAGFSIAVALLLPW